MTRLFQPGAAAAAALIACTGAALAQDYPARPVRVVVGFTVGTTTDILARLIGQKLGETWGQQVIVDNTPGAGGTIAAASAARAAPDGYTLLLAATSFIVSPSLYGKLQYDPVRDFAPVSLIALVPNVLVVHPSLPVKNVRDLVALARSQPGKLDYASSGKGSASHLNTELFKAMAGVDVVEIPYKSSAQALTDVISGQVTMNYPSLAAALPHIRSGRVKALAVSGARRSSAAPAVPSMAEYLPGYDAAGWYGFLAPAGTPKGIVTGLNRDVVKVVRLPDVKEKMSSQGAEVVGSTPEEFAAAMKAGRDKWDRLIKRLGIRIE